MDIAKHLLFHFSILIVILFIYHLWTDRFGHKTSKLVWVPVLFSSLVVSFFFSLSFEEQLQFDLRVIPIVIAGLYHGMGLLFIGLAVMFRGLINIDAGFYVSTFVYSLLFLVFYKMHPWFLNQSSKRKISVSILVTFLTNFTILLVFHFVIDPIASLSIWLAYILIPTLGMAIFVYVLEYIQQNDTLREHLVKTEKMDAVEHLGAAISHEIRNPLTSVQGFLQLIQEQKELSTSTREYTHIAMEELKQAEKVIKDYLTFAKPSLDHVEEIDIQQELDYVLSTLQPLTNKHSVNVEKVFTPVGWVLGERVKLRQCLFNLVKNAVESMPNGGTVTIETSRTEKQTIIRIQDVGVGMTREEISRLGEPYYSTKSGKGTGLGLMVVFSIVKAMNGFMDVQSQVNKGTTITLTFPIRKKSKKTITLQTGYNQSGGIEP